MFQLGKTSSCRLARHVEDPRYMQISKWIDHVKLFLLVRQYLNVNWSPAQWGDDNEIYLSRIGAYPRTINLLIQNTVAYIMLYNSPQIFRPKCVLYVPSQLTSLPHEYLAESTNLPFNAMYRTQFCVAFRTPTLRHTYDFHDQTSSVFLTNINRLEFIMEKVRVLGEAST